MHHFFVQSSTTEIAALWAIEVQRLKSHEIQMVTLRGYKPISDYPVVEPEQQWTRSKYWQKFAKQERLQHITNTLRLKAEDHVYTPQCNLPFIKIIHRSMPKISINLIEEGTANYIYKMDQPPYRNAFRMKRNDISTALIKLLFGKNILHKFGPGCFFPSYISSAFLLDERANTDFPSEQRIVADYKSFCTKIAPKQQSTRIAISVLVLDPLPLDTDEKITTLNKLISYANHEKSSHSRLIIKPHPRDDIAKVSAMIKKLGFEFQVSVSPIELLNASDDITELFVRLSSTALYAALLGIPIRLIATQTNHKTLIQKKIEKLVSTVSTTSPT